jgi:hypothetical protein
VEFEGETQKTVSPFNFVGTFNFLTMLLNIESSDTTFKFNVQCREKTGDAGKMCRRTDPVNFSERPTFSGSQRHATIDPAQRYHKCELINGFVIDQSCSRRGCIENLTRSVRLHIFPVSTIFSRHCNGNYSSSLLNSHFTFQFL